MDMPETTTPSPATWHVTARRDDHIDVGELCPRQPYLELQVPATARRVRRVVITTVSHDQGFSNDQERLGGTYEWSTSWFEVGVMTGGRSFHERVPSHIFQCNAHAVFTPRRHVTTWDVEGDGEGEGEDSDRGWLGQLIAGDTVQVIPRAGTCAWRMLRVVVRC